MFSYKRFSLFLGLSLLASTVVTVNQAQAQSLETENLFESTSSSSASGAGGSSQSAREVNHLSSFGGVGKRANSGASKSTSEASDLSSFLSAVANSSQNREDLSDSQEGNSPEASSITEMGGENNSEVTIAQAPDLQQEGNSETSTTSPSEGTGTSILGISTSIPSQPTAEKIPESSPSLIVWLGLAAAGFVHTRFKSQK